MSATDPCFHFGRVFSLICQNLVKSAVFRRKSLEFLKSKYFPKHFLQISPIWGVFLKFFCLFRVIFASRNKKISPNRPILLGRSVYLPVQQGFFFFLRLTLISNNDVAIFIHYPDIRVIRCPKHPLTLSLNTIKWKHQRCRAHVITCINAVTLHLNEYLKAKM